MKKKLSILAFTGLALMLGFAAPCGKTYAAAAPTYPVANTENDWIQTANGPVKVKYAIVSVATASAHSILVAGVAGKKIRVIGVALTNVVSLGTAVFETTTADAVITGAFSMAANGQLVLPNNRYGYFENTTGDGLDMTVTGSSNTVAGVVMYIQY